MQDATTQSELHSNHNNGDLPPNNTEPTGPRGLEPAEHDQPTETLKGGLCCKKSPRNALQRADFVTLHAALTEGSSGSRTLLGARELQLLKPGAYLVNCARCSLIDEEALLAALNEGRLAGVALDVFSQEPIGDDTVLRQLLSHERVIATPHLGASTVEAQVRVATEVARNIISALRGDTCTAFLNSHSRRQSLHSQNRSEKHRTPLDLASRASFRLTSSSKSICLRCERRSLPAAKRVFDRSVW